MIPIKTLTNTLAKTKKKKGSTRRNRKSKSIIDPPIVQTKNSKTPDKAIT